MIIVDSMTYEEIVKLFDELERPVILHRLRESGKTYRRLIKNTRNTERRYFKPIRFTSNRGFNIVLQCYDEGINFPRANRLGAFYYASFRKNRGTHLLTRSLVERQYWHYSIYTPHFLDRYNERFLKDPILTKQEIIDLFMENNRKVSIMRLKADEAKHPDEYWQACNNGLCLCRNPHDLFVEVRTFISWDMLGVDQQQFALKGKEYLQNRIGYELKVPEENFNEFIPDTEDRDV